MPGEGDAETRPKIEESRSMLEDGRVAWARGVHAVLIYGRDPLTWGSDRLLDDEEEMEARFRVVFAQ